jgi:hypothetical protein
MALDKMIKSVIEEEGEKCSFDPIMTETDF